MYSSSLAHTKWKCQYQYHIVFIPKYRRRVLYGRKECLRHRLLGAHVKCPYRAKIKPPLEVVVADFSRSVSV